MLESELKKEIAKKTTDLERLRREKEADEEKLRQHDLNLITAERIDLVQAALKNVNNEDIAKNGWFFIFGRRGGTDESFIKFTNEQELILPNSPDIFNQLKDVIYKILEEKKQELKQLN